MWMFRRLMLLVLPLFTVAWMAAPEWPARAAMLNAPWRDFWVPAATFWAQAHPVDTSTSVDLPSPHSPASAAVAGVAGPAASVSISLPAASTSVAAQAVATNITQRPATPRHGVVLVIGDSLMGEVAAGLRQHLPKRYAVIDRHKSSTGLTNLAYYDWPHTAAAETQAAQPAWVIIHMGANDAQDMLVNGHWLKFGSAPWQAQYEQRAQALVQAIRQEAPKAILVWVGLPAMRSATFDARMAIIRKLQQTAAQAQSVVYLDGHQALGPTYAKDGVGPSGHRHIWRADDGIHYSRTGGTLLAREAALAPALHFPWEQPGA